MRVVMVATDLSTDSATSLDRGARFAERLGAKLVAVHVVKDGRQGRDSEHAAQMLEAALASPGLGAVAAEYRVVDGDEVEAIVASAQREGAELIVVGRHRHTLLRDLFGHSTAEQVIEETRRMVLVASGHDAPLYRRVVVPVDFSEPSRQAILAAARLFPDADVRLVHAYDVPFQGFLTGVDTQREVEGNETEALDTLLRELSGSFFDETLDHLRARTSLRQGETTSVVAREVRDLGAGLIVIGARGAGRPGRGSIGGVARALIEDPPCDVLVIGSS